MAEEKNDPDVPDEILMSKIYYIRGHKVMIDRDLAALYGVETKRLKEQVNRNIERFPAHFMFELTREEEDALRSQFATLKRGEHAKYLPFALTVIEPTAAAPANDRVQSAGILKSQFAIASPDV